MSREDTEKLAHAMIKAGKNMLNETKSIHAPCNNAYKDARDGYVECSCWRCNPRGKSAGGRGDTW